jgi:hypothetical protein
MNRRDFGKLCGLLCITPALSGKPARKSTSKNFSVPVQAGERFEFATCGQWSGAVSLEVDEGFGFHQYVPAYISDYDMNASLTGKADVVCLFRMNANIKEGDKFLAMFSNETTMSQWVA